VYSFILFAWYTQHPEPTFFFLCYSFSFLQSLAEKAKVSGTASEKELTTMVMVVGMPNVGKSSLINSLRRIGVKKGKAAPTGAIPGITRTVAGTIKVLESPKVYLIDTPGVMIPHIPDPVSAIKVALTGKLVLVRLFRFVLLCLLAQM